MNKRNDWEQLLDYANQDLALVGYGIKLEKWEDEGTYSLSILKNGKGIEVYADNYYEDELSDLITDAWHYVKTKN